MAYYPPEHYNHQGCRSRAFKPCFACGSMVRSVVSNDNVWATTYVLSLSQLTRSTSTPSAELYSLFILCFVFALYERKNETQIIGTYHAAAGEKAWTRGTAYVLSLIIQRPQIILPDRSGREHGCAGQVALPVRAVDPALHQRHVRF